MDADEREIYDFLKSFRHEYIGAKEIAKRAGGKWRFREDPNWPIPAITRLVERKIVETDGYGHFRLSAKEKKEKKQFISPEMKKILEQGGQQFEIEEENEEPGQNPES